MHHTGWGAFAVAITIAIASPIAVTIAAATATVACPHTHCPSSAPHTNGALALHAMSPCLPRASYTPPPTLQTRLETSIPGILFQAEKQQGGLGGGWIPIWEVTQGHQAPAGDGTLCGGVKGHQQGDCSSCQGYVLSNIPNTAAAAIAATLQTLL